MYDLSNYSPEQAAAIAALQAKAYTIPGASTVTLYTSGQPVAAIPFNLRVGQIHGLLSYLEDSRRDETTRATLAEQALDTKQQKSIDALTRANWVATAFTGTLATVVDGKRLTLTAGEAVVIGNLVGLPYTNYQVSFLTGSLQNLVAVSDGTLKVQLTAVALLANEVKVGDWDGTTYTPVTAKRVISGVTEFLNTVTFPGGVSGGGSSGLDRAVTFGSDAPTTGAHAAGDLHFNGSPDPGEAIGWQCLTAGTPGLWYPMGFLHNIRTVTGSDSTSAADVILLVNSASPATITLPAGATWPFGKELTIKDIGGAVTNHITCVAGAGTTLGEAAVINADFGSLTFYLHGSIWRIK